MLASLSSEEVQAGSALKGEWRRQAEPAALLLNLFAPVGESHSISQKSSTRSVRVQEAATKFASDAARSDSQSA